MEIAPSLRILQRKSFPMSVFSASCSLCRCHIRSSTSWTSTLRLRGKGDRVRLGLRGVSEGRLRIGCGGEGGRGVGEIGRNTISLWREQTQVVERTSILGSVSVAAVVLWLGMSWCSVRAAELCTEVVAEDTNWMIVAACVAEAVALTGAAVGGIVARQRKKELEIINDQLRKINGSLRRQARVESYAPSLTYAPVGGGRLIDAQVSTDSTNEEVLQRLKIGKRFLREMSPASAFGEFERALSLAQKFKDTEKEKKAARGLGASCQRLGKFKEAIKYHTLVLTVSQLTGEYSGDTEALGAIADCYTELGDLEMAAKFYDRYIGQLEKDD